MGKAIIELSTGKEFALMVDAARFYGMPNATQILRQMESGIPITKGKHRGLFFIYEGSGVEIPEVDKEFKEYPTSRPDAIASGATHYFTGRPCKRGHVVPRLTKGACTECRKEDWQRDNDRRKLEPKSEASKAAGRRYYLRNVEMVKAKAKVVPAETKRKYKLKNKKANPEYYRSLGNARRRRLRDCTPACQTEEDRKEIREIYATALRMKELTGILYEVDHQVPVISDVVCGLHVPWNLEVLTKEANLAKSNSI